MAGSPKSNALNSWDDDVPTMDHAIRAAEAVLPTLGPGPSRRMLLERLAEQKYLQYESFNQWTALESAMVYLQELIEDTDDDDIGTTERISYSYSKCLRSRFMRGRNEQDLEEAIKFASESVARTELAKAGKLQITERLENLWHCLFTKVHQLDDSTDGDLSQMMAVAEQAETAAQSLDQSRYIIRTKENLALAYQIKWERDQNYYDLVYSLRLGREVVKLIPSEGEDSALKTAYSNMAFRLQRAYSCWLENGLVPPDLKADGGEELLSEAIEYLNASTKLVGDRLLSGPEDTLTFVMYIGNFPAEKRGQVLGESAAALRRSLEDLKKICAISSQEDRQDILSTMYGISRYAAAAAIQREEDPYEALLLLEYGRGLAVSSQFGNMQDIDFENVPDKNIARKYQDARDAFQESLAPTFSPGARKERLDTLQRIEDRIRTIPGAAPSRVSLDRDEMLQLADRMDIVTINITDIRCDAIVIQQSRYQVIELRQLDEDQLSEKSWEVQKRLAQEENQEDVFPDLFSHTHNLLRDIWKTLAKPVLDALGYKAQPQPNDSWPHICWIPTGVLCLYPIHAAGIGFSRGKSVMERVISSYAPSLTVISRLRRQRINTASPSEPQSKCIVVAMRDTPSRQPLEQVDEEVRAVHSNLPEVEVLTNPGTEEVLEALARQPRIAHFTCHGEVDYDFPLLSKLLTRDWEETPLVVNRLQSLDLNNAKLAYLSACFTANAGLENLQDESIHIAGSLLLAGFSNVVGSLWYVGEDASLEVVRRFYKYLGDHAEAWDSTIAQALHFAILDFRATTCSAANKMRGNPIEWAPFIHLGI